MDAGARGLCRRRRRGLSDHRQLHLRRCDDLSVVALCPPSVTNKTVACGSPWTFDPPVGVDRCSGSNVTVTVASTVTNSFCSGGVTRTWLLTDLCGNSNTWSQSVTFAGGSPPTINCGCLQ